MICALPGNEALATRLRGETGRAALRLEYRRFPDGESYVRFEGEMRGADVVLVCTLNEPDVKTVPLLFAARTARELGAARVGLVAPYLAYMRQDRRFKDGEAIASKHYAALLSAAFDWLVTADAHLHRHASLGEVYSIPAMNVAAAPAVAAWISANVSRPLVLGPDEESRQWAAQVAAACGAPHTVMSKTRLGDRKVEIHAPRLDEWADRTPVLIDDIVSSARTMALAAERIRQAGLAAPVCVAVHAVFAPGAMDALRTAGVSAIVTTNTIAHETNRIDLAHLIAEEMPAAY